MLGKIVHYYENGISTEGVISAGEPMAAIITKVISDSEVHITLFPANASPKVLANIRICFTQDEQANCFTPYVVLS